MARARMIARNITKSKKIAQLSDSERVMYAFILPFLDREGRINAHETYLKGNVFLHLEYTEAQIRKAVERFHDIGLATVYATEDDVVLEYAGFLTYNRPDRKEVASEFPAPSDEAREANRTVNPPGIAQAKPRQSPDVSSGEVEVEVKVEGEVEAEVEVQEVETKKPEIAAAAARLDEKKQQSYEMIKKRLGSRLGHAPPGEEELLGECLDEDPSRIGWFDIPPNRVQQLMHLANKEREKTPGGVFKTIFIRMLDYEASTDMVSTTAKPPLFRAPPHARRRLRRGDHARRLG